MDKTSEYYKSLESLVNPIHSLRWLCIDCDVPYIIVDKGFAVEATDKLQNCFNANHNIIPQILHNEVWKELLMAEPTYIGVDFAKKGTKDKTVRGSD